MKKAISILLTLGMTLSLAACGGADTTTGTTGTETKTSNKTGDTITMAIWDNNQLAGIQKIADEWSETSGVQVEIETLDWSTYWTMLEAGVSGGEMPDVFWMHSGYAKLYEDADVLLNLNDYIANDDAIDLNNYYDGIVKLYSQDGNQYAIPKDHDTIAVVYNKAVFDKYGVEYPTDDMSWQDFADKAQEISEKGKDDGVYGTYMNCGSNQSGWYNLIYAYGGKVISDDGTKSEMDSPETIKAMQFVVDEILPACPSQDAMANTGGDVMLGSGTVGMYLDGSWMVNSYYAADNKDDLAWVEIPYADLNENGQCDEGERVSIYNGLGWSIYKNSENQDAAWSLVSALTSKDGQMKQSEYGVTMAAYKGCSEAYANAFDGMDISAFLKVEENGTLAFRPYSKYTGRWEDNFTTFFIDVWNNPSLLESTMHDIADDMNSYLEKEQE